MSLAIEVHNLSKVFQIGKKQSSVRDTFSHLISKKTNSAEFWALQNVSFNIEQGKVLGIVGRNGAGKSTLLKIISKISPPTSGYIKINGRVASLLEVGTGFHPDLTGRQNIYLNGTILGMTKTEINARFDEIVAFSGIEQFIDTPVKRYSSGMYVRLAFAVAAHLEPEILIVDEVLAVGDMAFQKKCLGKMKDVVSTGRTVLFVSHNTQAIRSLCTDGVFLKNGEIHAKGSIQNVLSAYDKDIQDFQFGEQSALNNAENRRGLGQARFTAIAVSNTQKHETNTFETDEPIHIKLSFRATQDLQQIYVAVAFRSSISREIVSSIRHQIPFQSFKAGEIYTFECVVNQSNIRTGEYPLYFWLGDQHNTPYDVVDDLVAPIVIHSNKTFEQLGYDSSVHSGYFSMVSSIKVI